MKYFEPTAIKWSCMSWLIPACLFVSAISLQAQNPPCSLACNGNTQVSLDIDCEALITADMILNDQATSCPAGNFVVTVSNAYGQIPNPVTSAYIGQNLYAKVSDTNTGNSCWGNITLEDKLGPIIQSCPTAPVEVNCSDLSVFEGPIYFDACEGFKDPVLVSESITPLSCNPDYVKTVVRVYTAYDSRNNRALNCSITYNVRRFDFGQVQCPPDYTQFSVMFGCPDNRTALSCDGNWKPGQSIGEYDTDTNGDGILDSDVIWDDNGNEYPDPDEVGVPYFVSMINGDLDTVELFPFPDVYCNSVVTYNDIAYPKIGCTKKIVRLWVLREWHCNGEVLDTIPQVIEIVDEEAPVLDCPAQFTTTTNTIMGSTNSSYGSVTCGSSLAIPLPDAVDNCSENLSYDISYSGGFIKNYNGTQPVLLPMGSNAVTYTVYDECYNSSQCQVLVTVEDNTPPVTVCDQFTAVSLTAGGEAVVNASSFDDGSYDDCKLHCMLVRRMTPDGCDCRIPRFCDLDYIGELNGSYYYISDYSISADIAKRRANAYGGSLAILENELEQDWLLSKVRQNYNGAFWLGMKRLGNQYLWDDHAGLAYENWEAYSPDNGDCVYMNSSNNWEDTGCFNEYPYILEIKDICGFSQVANFCCSDVGTDQMVSFRVVDIFGNFNDCMVSVDIQDKVAPSLICPPNTTVDCDTPLDVQNLAQYGEPILSDDCGATVTETGINDLGSCNLGTYTRVFTATDDGGRSSSCKQVLTFVNPNPFTGPIDVICPEDVTIVGCMAPEDLSPDVMGYPEFVNQRCGLLGTDWDDEIYTFNNGTNGNACFKILRTWEVIDWCQPNLPVFSCVQVIKVTNGDKPIIEGIETLNVCTFDSECEGGFIELEVTASDSCTDDSNLRWSYAVYAGELGEGPKSFSNPVVTGSGDGNTANASGDYPIGTHIVRWTFFDRCGNATTRDQEFTIANCKAPTAYCINGLAVNLMPMDLSGDGEPDFAMVELWASDFDAGSFHPCGYEVSLSFEPDSLVQNITFDCTTRGEQEVNIYASVTGPDGEVYQSFCTSTVNVQDNNNACQGQKDVLVTVGGNIFTEDLENMGDVKVTLEGSELTGVTDINGSYAFAEMPTGGDYIVEPYYNGDPLNGISTLDIIEIQRHLLGLEPITSPYKLIAADINKDYRISAQDLLELRKLILGIYDEFPSNTSWRFVDNAYEFLDPLNPFNESFKEDYLISRLSEDMDIDFVAIKVGDVNDNSTGSAQPLDNGNNAVAVTELQIDEAEFNAGDVIDVPVVVNRDDIQGMQFTLLYDNSLIDITSIKSSAGEFNQSHYRITEEGIAISWNVSGARLTNRELFVVNAVAKGSGSVSDVFDLSSSLVKAEVYDENGEISTPVISSKSERGEAFKVYQNTPNPFADNTEVRFNLDQAGSVELIVSDVQGRVVSQVSRSCSKGINAYTIQANELGGPGIYYLTVNTPRQSSTIKMVVLR